MSSQKFIQLDHTGDLRVMVFGKSLKELFENSAIALFSQITDISRVNHDSTDSLHVTGIDKEELLVSWLSELNYMHITEGKLFSKFDISHISDTKLTAIAFGEKYNPFRHSSGFEIKAVTFHDLQIEKKDDLWQTRIVFDI
ncbi:MAG: archease [Candidatus Zhuqueibacterota bacterium]